MQFPLRFVGITRQLSLIAELLLNHETTSLGKLTR